MNNTALVTSSPVNESLLAPQDQLKFMLAGNATFTLRSEKTGKRYTYKIQKAKNGGVWFVKLLTGPDNQSSYTYLGMIKNNRFSLTSKSRLTLDSAPVAGIEWFVRKNAQGTSASSVQMFHAGRCGRCNRVLTVPESLAAGIGPECSKYIM